MSDTGNKTDAALEAAFHYDEFFGPFYFEPYALEIVKRIDPAGIHLALELAAGTGRVTRHIRQRLSSAATLIASDISTSMLTVAQRKLGQLPIQWQEIDAQHLPFEDDSIDLLVCAFGYMFVDDKAKALAEAFRVLKPGAQFIFSSWDKLEEDGASFTAKAVAMDFLKTPFPESANLSTSMHNHQEIKSMLETAGFNAVSVETVKLLATCATAKIAAEGLLSGGPVYDEIIRNDYNHLETIKLRLQETLGDKFGSAPMKAPISALISQAWK